jgi:photosystem II stability/assembly factor-like uncharacterized protein
MRRLFILAVLYLGSFVVCLPQQTPWEWVNPLPQGNSLNFVWAINPDTAVAVGGYGTVLRTSNGGITWQVEPTVGGQIGALYANQFISGTIGWAVGESGTILKTTDAGETWFTYNISTYNDFVALCFVSDSIGWVAGTGGKIYKTTDGGITWSEQTSGITGAVFALNFISPTSGWAVGFAGKILHTTNGGTTWDQQTSNTPQPLFSVQFVTPLMGWAVGAYGVVVKTLDGGTTWTPQFISPHPNLYSAQFINATTGWAVGSYGTIQKTTNGGLTWFLQTTDTYNDLYGVRFVSPTTGWAVGDFGTILTTTDGGATWNNQSSGPKTELYGIHFPTATYGYMVGDEGTILKTTNGGVSWQKQNSGVFQPLYGVYFVSPTEGWAVGDSAVILKTTNGGTTWKGQDSRQEVCFYSIYFADATTGWAVGDEGKILKTINGGAFWSEETLATPTYSPLQKIKFLNHDVGWAVGYSGLIVKTTNGGASWIDQSNSTFQDLYSLDIIDLNTVYAVGDLGTVIVTTDGGTTWDYQTVDTDLNLYGIEFQSSSTGWVVGEDGIILKTTNGGADWLSQISRTENTLWETQFIRSGSGGVIFAAGIGGTILCSAVSPFPLRTWTGTYDSLWSVAGNWSPIGVPDAMDSVLIPTTATGPVLWNTEQQINIAALTIQTGAKLTIRPGIAQLIIKSNTTIHGTLEIDPAATTEIISGGNFIVESGGKFIPGKSTVVFTNDGLVRGSFYNLLISEGASVHTTGNVEIKNNLAALSDIHIRPTDTLTIKSPYAQALQGSGLTGAGTIKRAILPGSIETYRFESTVTYVRFYPTGTYPDTVVMTTYPNTLTAGMPDSIFVKRYYTISSKGGSNFRALLSLRYDTSETHLPLDGLSLFRDSSNILTNMGKTDYLDSDLVAISLDSVNGFSTWYFGREDYFPKHPYEFTDSLFLTDNGSYTDTLIFGAIPGASDSIDAVFGEVPLGPKPPIGTFDVRWAITGTQGSLVNIQDVFRGDRIENIYTCNLQPSSSGYPFTIRWNKNILPVGSFFLRDQATQGGQFNVNMKNQNSFTITNPLITSIQVVYIVPRYYTFNRNWNMISLPLTLTTDGRKTTIFPMATSEAYGYNHRYETFDTLKNRMGYWLKFPTAKTLALEGLPRTSDTIEVLSGWNMIGSISSVVAVKNITQIPSNIVVGNYYTFAGGYITSDSIRSAKGYWIKVSSSGKLVLSSTGSNAKLPSTISSATDELKLFNSITFFDQEGNHQTLYFSKMANPTMTTEHNELPPLPPQGIFDARFNSDRTLELLPIESSSCTVRIQSGAYPIRVSWHIAQAGIKSVTLIDPTTGKSLNPHESGIDGNVVIQNSSITKIELKLDRTSAVPKEYSLKQNYPNPFNPTTKVAFDLPTQAIITLKVFNILGQEVVTLADNENYAAGSHSLIFNASNLGSGIYFYRLIAHGSDKKDFQQVKKMISIK